MLYYLKYKIYFYLYNVILNDNICLDLIDDLKEKREVDEETLIKIGMDSGGGIFKGNTFRLMY